MCGIIAYYGDKEETKNTLLSGLKRLEYRGYDSAGIAIMNDLGEIKCVKAVGKVVELERKIEQIADLDGSIGIAHTRWATHGVPSEQNAHPHHSYDKKVYLVHNGIIENYKELKAELQAKGIEFYSQTDTEVIANLIAQMYDGSMKSTLPKALKKLKGAYAIAVLHTDENDKMFAAKMGAPLVLGLSENELILASDVSAIIHKTRDVIYINDGEWVELHNKKYIIRDIKSENGSNVQPTIERIEWDAESAEKDGFDHYLLKEIFEQPKTLTDSCRGRLLLDQGNVKFGGLLDVQERLRTIERVVLLGVGTSFYACKLGELFFEDVAKISAKAEMSPEFRYKNPFIDDKTWVIAVSQSGETADTIAAIEEAKQKGALVTGLVNTVGSTISRITQAGVYNHIGPEISVASTKAFTSQSTLLLMHAILLGRMRGLSLNEGKRLIKAIQNLPNLVEKVLEQNQNIQEIAKNFVDYQNLMYIGRNYNFPIALEGALKIKEISYIHAEGLSGGELKHGFIALIEEKMPTIAIATQDSVYEKQLSNIEEIKARSGKVIAIGTEGDKKLAQIADTVIEVPACDDEIGPLVNVIPLQLLAYHVSVARGLDVDKPRNLAKSVTVE